MAAKALPPCKNTTCPDNGSNRAVKIIKEDDANYVFGCKTCLGVQVVTVNWKRGEQEHDYIQHGRPEYARQRAFFDLGKRS